MDTLVYHPSGRRPVPTHEQTGLPIANHHSGSPAKRRRLARTKRPIMQQYLVPTTTNKIFKTAERMGHYKHKVTISTTIAQVPIAALVQRMAAKQRLPSSKHSHDSNGGVYRRRCYNYNGLTGPSATYTIPKLWNKLCNTCMGD